MRTFVLLVITLSVLFSCKKGAESTITDEIDTSVEKVRNAIDSVKTEIVEQPTKKSIKQIKQELTAKGFEIFDYVDEESHDTIIMQKYFMVFLKEGPIRGQNEEEATVLQSEHLAHLSKMYELGYADISGPFADDGDIKGVTVYNVPTLKMADSLANSDPMVKAGRLEVEIHPWWAGKGFLLR